MHLFDGEGDITQTQRQFWTAIVSVAAVTYLGAVAVLSGVQRRKKLRSWFSNWWPPIRQPSLKSEKRRSDFSGPVNESGGEPSRNNAAASSGSRDSWDHRDRVLNAVSEKHETSHFRSLFRHRPGVNADLEKADKGKMVEISRAVISR